MIALVAEAKSDCLSIDGIKTVLEQAVKERSSDVAKILPTESICPSCGRGRVVVSGQGDLRYKICTNNGKAGCGWSEVI